VSTNLETCGAGGDVPGCFSEQATGYHTAPGGTIACFLPRSRRDPSSLRRLRTAEIASLPYLVRIHAVLWSRPSPPWRTSRPQALIGAYCVGVPLEARSTAQSAHLAIVSLSGGGPALEREAGTSSPSSSQQKFRHGCCQHHRHYPPPLRAAYRSSSPATRRPRARRGPAGRCESRCSSSASMCWLSCWDCSSRQSPPTPSSRAITLSSPQPCCCSPRSSGARRGSPNA